VKRSYPMLQQNQLLRTNALGSYSDLLYGIAKDPAMLIFLNNNSNRKGNPNENLARELMELFSLGVGNYSEADIKEAARALTGRSTTREGKYEYRERLHDDGEKTVLGVKGKLDGDGLVKVILQQDACPRYIARKLITYFEGVEPTRRASSSTRPSCARTTSRSSRSCASSSSIPRSTATRSSARASRARSSSWSAPRAAWGRRCRRSSSALAQRCSDSACSRRRA